MGPYFGISPLALDVKLRPHLYLTIDPTSIAIPVPHLTAGLRPIQPRTRALAIPRRAVEIADRHGAQVCDLVEHPPAQLGRRLRDFWSVERFAHRFGKRRCNPSNRVEQGITVLSGPLSEGDPVSCLDVTELAPASDRHRS